MKSSLCPQVYITIRHVAFLHSDGLVCWLEPAVAWRFCLMARLGARRVYIWQDHDWRRLIAQHITTQDIELGTISAVQIESGPDSMSAPQQVVTQPVGRGDLARDILQRSSVRVQPSEEQDRSILRPRYHLASVPEGVSSSVTTVHEQRARFQENRMSIDTSLEDFPTWTCLEIRTQEAKDHIKREKTEWQEECLSRNALIATSSSWTDLEWGIRGW